jgi:F0F1-type ATP synthase membrane subunit a
MAVIVFLWVQITMVRSNGLFGWLKHLTWGPPPVLELISEIARPVSLALRLFGNIFAGEVLLLVMSNLIPPGVPVLFMAFELFVGIVQALIFAILTLAFLSLASAHHSDEAEHAAAH